MNEKNKVCLFGVTCVAALEVIYMIVLQGDGIALAASTGAICTIVGFTFGRKVVKQ